MIEHCRLCGKGVMTAVECRLHGGAVHQEHCLACEWFSDWHCLYGYKLREEEERRCKEEERARQELKSKEGPSWKQMLNEWRESVQRASASERG